MIEIVENTQKGFVVPALLGVIAFLQKVFDAEKF